MTGASRRDFLNAITKDHRRRDSMSEWVQKSFDKYDRQRIHEAFEDAARAAALNGSVFINPVLMFRRLMKITLMRIMSAGGFGIGQLLIIPLIGSILIQNGCRQLGGIIMARTTRKTVSRSVRPAAISQTNER